jgi:hypothetical protein
MSKMDDFEEAEAIGYTPDGFSMPLGKVKVPKTANQDTEVDEILETMIDDGTFYDEIGPEIEDAKLKAKSTLYQRLLEVIGADEPNPMTENYDFRKPVEEAKKVGRNQLRAAQRKALAELFGEKDKV